MTEADRIRKLIADYAAAVDAADVRLASQVWDNSPDVSFIHPLGHAHGWGEVKTFFTDVMGGMFADRKLTRERAALRQEIAGIQGPLPSPLETLKR